MPHVVTAREFFGIPLFRGLSSAELEQIARIAETVSFEAGEVIVHQGRQVQRLWVLLAGQCEVILDVPTRRKPVHLAQLEPFACFGEMSFFHAAPHSASVRAKTAVRLLRVEREAFDALLDGGSPVAYKIALNTIHNLAERLRRMDDWVAELVNRDCAEKRVDELSMLREKLFNGWKL